MLSACETGLGRTAGGEGVLGLQRAFGEAGCRTVIASLWKVDDEATRELMGHFYRCLWEEGLPPLEALANGRSSHRRRAPVSAPAADDPRSGRPGFSAATLAGCPDSVRYIRPRVNHEKPAPTAGRPAVARRFAGPVLRPGELGRGHPAVRPGDGRLAPGRVLRLPRRSSSRSELVVVGLDDVSLRELPKPLVAISPELAEVVGDLDRRGAAAIGLDILVPDALDGYDSKPGLGGNDLGVAAAPSGRVVLPVILDDAGRPILPLSSWQTGSRAFGVVGTTEDRDRFVRRVKPVVTAGRAAF